MTAILGFSYKNVPCLIGDLLLSSDEKWQDVPMPIDGKSSFQFKILKNKKYVASLCQKLVQIGPHMMIAFATEDLFATIELIKELKKKYTEIDPERMVDLKRVGSEVDIPDSLDVSFIVVYCIENKMELHGNNTVNAKAPTGEKMAVAGSGYSEAIKLFHYDIEIDTEQSNYSQALGRLLLVASSMWSKELAGSSIKKAFGGGYEIAIQQGNKISKIGDIVFMNYVFVPDKGLGAHSVIKKVDYIGEILVVSILEMTTGSVENQLEIKRAYRYLLPPVYGIDSYPTNEEVEKQIPDMNAKYYVTHLEIKHRDSTKGSAFRSYYEIRDNRKEGPIVFKYEGSSSRPTSISTRKKFILRMVEDALKVLDSEN